MPSIHHARPDKRGAFRHPAFYDQIGKRQLRRLYARVAADVVAAELPDGAHVLDVGTGPGRGCRVYRETVRTWPLSLGLLARLAVRPAG
jgi:hypothetical protein